VLRAGGRVGLRQVDDRALDHAPLPEAGRIAGGRVELDGIDLLGLPEAAMRAVRGKRVAMIFQEPSTALNPVLTIGRQVSEVIERHAGTRNNKDKGS
jgi:peptide/nickel transport system ATP-binding protein